MFDLRFFLLLPLTVLLGCGGASSRMQAPSAPATPPVTVVPPASVPPNVSGNWDMGLEDPVSFAPIFQFLGALSSQGSTVTGVFRINDPQHSPPCIPASQDIQFTGSIDAKNLMTLTSASFAGSIAELKVQLPPSTIPGNLNNATGTARIVGTVCPIASATVLPEFVPSITGTYTGSLGPTPGQSLSGPAGSATIILTESPADADGQFPLSGSLSFQSPLCVVSTTLSGKITGPFFLLNTEIPGMQFQGVANGSPQKFTATSANLYVPPSIPSCASGFYGGDLSIQ